MKTNNDCPGVEGEVLFVTFGADFVKEDVLSVAEGVMVEIISEPKIKYKSGYWRILEYLTFRRFFQYHIYHKVKIVKNER